MMLRLAGPSFPGYVLLDRIISILAVLLVFVAAFLHAGFVFRLLGCDGLSGSDVASMLGSKAPLVSIEAYIL